MYVLVENNEVVSVQIDNNVFENAIESPEDIVYGDHLIDGEWIRDGYRPKPIIVEPYEQRKQAYATMKLISWETELLTVNEANDIFGAYFAEGDNIKYNEIQGLIAPAKEEIRKMYPDKEV